MIRPQRLRPGDAVAAVSLSSGMGGEALFRHRYELGKQRLESAFGLRVVPMPNALRGVEYLDVHPEARAADWMQAVRDPEIKAVFSLIGGDDAIRLLPYIDFDLLRQYPKIFLGYSDSTANHLMLQRAGVVSFYGPCILSEFAENAAMHAYTASFVRQVLFEGAAPLPVPTSPAWTSEFLDWAEEANDSIARSMTPDAKGYELLQGEGTVSGPLLGGCVDTFPMLMGTAVWPRAQAWEGAILFLETSEEQPAPSALRLILRGLAAQGVFDRVNGVVVGKPMGEVHYEAYKEVYRKVIGQECARPDLPVLYNANFGHAAPICTLPYGVCAEIDCARRAFTLLETAVV